MAKLFIYHANCLDGYGAAYALYRKFSSKLFYAAQYSREPPYSLIKDNEVYIVDFSYSKAIMQQLCDLAGSVTLIDHHKTAIEELSDFEHKKLIKKLDINASGAVLTWEFLELGPLPEVYKRIQDRDLWRWEYPDTGVITRAMYSYEFDVNLFDKWVDVPDAFNLLKIEGATRLMHLTF
jgi:oligoribonuclease NrnB/cAMP/cGMP phosphodiesterase (DHH superfamily)